MPIPPIILPRNVNPVGRCDLCDETFYTFGDMRRHWRDKAKLHLELARHISEQVDRRPIEERLPIFAPWDPEVHEHMQKVGDRMKAEGRLTVKKSERAGF